MTLQRIPTGAEVFEVKAEQMRAKAVRRLCGNRLGNAGPDRTGKADHRALKSNGLFRCAVIEQALLSGSLCRRQERDGPRH
jgi:hypothetical protein